MTIYECSADHKDRFVFKITAADSSQAALNIESDFSRRSLAAQPGMKHATENTVGDRSSQELEEILTKVCDWSAFNVFQLDRCSGGRPLQLVTLRLLSTLGIVQRLQIDIARLSGFLAAAEQTYLNQPYHNNIHAADVVQALGSMMVADDWAAALDDLEKLAIVIAAATHDLGHPGVNNDFHLRTNSDLAQAYKEIGSINENNHAALALGLLSLEHSDFLSHLSVERLQVFKDLLKDLILCTDMAHHNTVTTEFKACVESLGSDLQSWPDPSRRCALRMVLHCADISNPARPLEHCAEWGRRVQEEMFCQGDQEREVGLKPARACDRSSGCPSRSQADFIQHVMAPSMETLEPVAPKFVAAARPHIAQSLEYWQSLHEEVSPTKRTLSNGSEHSGSAVIKILAP